MKYILIISLLFCSACKLPNLFGGKNKEKIQAAIAEVPKLSISQISVGNEVEEKYDKMAYIYHLFMIAGGIFIGIGAFTKVNRFFYVGGAFSGVGLLIPAIGIFISRILDAIYVPICIMIVILLTFGFVYGIYFIRKIIISHKGDIKTLVHIGEVNKKVTWKEGGRDATKLILQGNNKLINKIEDSQEKLKTEEKERVERKK